MSGALAIRYNGMVFAPTGDFATNEPSQGLVWWHYLLIAVGALLLLLTCITLVAVLVMVCTRSKKNAYQEGLKVFVIQNS